MTLTEWRIVKKKFTGTAFDGEGAREYGGRWNSPGKRVVYTSGSVALALLEMLVHVDSSLLSSYLVIPARFDDSAVSAVDALSLPDDWRTHPAPFTLRQIGDKWLESLSSPVLKVPSAIVPDEQNYLLNPDHPHFSKISIGDPVQFEIDLRLLDG